MMKWFENRMGFNSRQFIIYLFLIVLFSKQLFGKNQAKCSTLDTDGVTIPRGDIIVKEGDPLEIFCILHDDYMNRPEHFNSSHLVFYRGDHPLPAEMFEIVNSSTIKLYIENVKTSLSSYYCRFNESTGHSQNICMNKVAVDTKPKEVTNFTCISLNWVNLTCTWRVPHHNVETNYKLTFTLPARAARGMEYPCPGNKSEILEDGTYRCFWSLGTRPIYRQGYKLLKFTMVGTNVFGNTTQYFDFNHLAHIKPDRPENFVVVNRTAHSALLAWNENRDLKNYLPGLVYRMMYKSQPGTDKWKEIDIDPSEVINRLNNANQSIKMYELKNLEYAHAFYDVRLQVRVALARADCCWSDYATLVFRTLSTIPSAPPSTTVGSFQIVEGTNRRHIYVYWQQIKRYEQNGDDFEYKVVVYEIDGNNKIRVNIEPNETSPSYAKFDNMGFGEYEFEIFSKNKVNRSRESSYVRVPGNRSLIPEPLGVTKIAFEEQARSQTYELSWKTPKTDPRHPITTYTIFWCKNEKDWPFQCTGFLDWFVVNSSQTVLNKTFNDNEIYQFAISANSGDLSSGMVWASCTIIHNRFKGKMKNIWIRNVGATFIDVGWTLDCSDRIENVKGFRIYYCPIKHVESNVCSEPEKNLTVRGYLHTNNGNITNLKPYTTYRLQVAAVTNDNLEGPKSDYKFNTTFQSSPSVPRNFKATKVTNDSITIEWDAPEAINGVFQYYSIQYYPEGNFLKQNETRVTDKKSYHLNKTLGNLRSFTKYHIELKACTKRCSEPAIVKNTTLIGVPGQMEPPQLFFVNQTLFVFKWDKPGVIGGPLKYELKSEIRRSDSNIEVNTFNTSAQNLSVPITHCEKENHNGISYLWYIRAVTVNEHGETLFGDWSKSAVNVECPRLKYSYYLVYILFGISLLIGLGIFAFCGNKIWNLCKNMKDVGIILPPGLEKDRSVEIQGTIILSSQLKIPKDKPQDTSHISHPTIMAPDEQLLIEKKSAFDAENDMTVNQTDSGCACNSGNESISSSTPITNLDLTIEDTSSPEKDDCSLRLRNNVPGKPVTSTDSLVNANPVCWNKGYVTVPTPEKPDPFTGPWSKAMQLKNLDAYSQIGMDNVQMKAPTNVISGYIPHSAPSTQPVPVKQSIYVPISPSSGYVLHKVKPELLAKNDSNINVAQLKNENVDNKESTDESIEIENSECASLNDTPLVDLRLPSDSDDLISIGDNVEYNLECVRAQEPTTTPYVPLASALSRSASQRSSDVPKQVASIDLTSIVPIVQSKPTTPNPYSRVGTWDTPMNLPSIPPAVSPTSYIKWKQPSTSPNTDNVELGLGPSTIKSSSGYVPHRQFDPKLLKED